ncbi:MAG TPA: hypothetical protein VJN18_31080 [Polyangiaceae bacterium]|nr:hypothetical protein [Polyangiaceae bacterium]
MGALACTAKNEEPSVSPATAGAHSDAIDSTSGAAGNTTPLPASWCAAHEVLEQKCQRCHSAPTENGAPFSLVTYADTQIRTPQGKHRYELIAAALTNDFMPPLWLSLDPEVVPLTDPERSTLLSWCETGAHAASPPDSDCSDP